MKFERSISSYQDVFQKIVEILGQVPWYMYIFVIVVITLLCWNILIIFDYYVPEMIDRQVRRYRSRKQVQNKQFEKV